MSMRTLLGYMPQTYHHSRSFPETPFSLLPLLWSVTLATKNGEWNHVILSLFRTFPLASNEEQEPLRESADKGDAIPKRRT